MPPIELHHVATDAQWPLEVQPLSRHLSKPLHSVSRDACLSETYMLSELLDELRSATSTSPSSLAPNAHPLSGFLDIILATVSSLRQMKEDPHPFTMPIWSTLIRALCYTCYSDVEISNSRSTRGKLPPGCSDQTVVPENTCSDHKSSGDPEETGVHWECEDGPNANNDTNVSEVETDTRTFSFASDPLLVEDLCDEKFDVSYDPTQSEKWLAASHCFSSPPSKASSTSSLDVPFHAHVLPDRENIVPLVASVAYQRRVWGIEDPVVGVILTKDGFSAQVVLGWTDPPDLCSDSESPDDDTFDDLPTVHIAYSDSPCVANGVFNLTDPISTLAFSQFIVELRDQYDKVVRECCDPRVAANSTFTWRSDLIDPPRLFDRGEQREESVASWIRGLRTPSSVDTEDDPPPYPITPPPTQPFDHIPTSDPMKKAGGGDEPDSFQRSGTEQDGEQTGYKGATISSSVSRSFKSKSTSELSATLPSISSSIQSCSEFAKKAEYGIGPSNPLSMTTYTYERYVLSISALKLSSDLAKREEINHYVSIYNDLSCFRDPAWQLEEELPVVKGAYLEAVRRCFWRQLVAVRERQDQNFRLVDELHQPIISERLSLFFWVTLGAFCRGQRKSVNEAESRLQWDTLILHVLNSLASKDDGVHIRPLFERSLLLSRNRFSDTLNSAKTTDEVMSEARTRARDYHALCSASQAAVYDTDSSFSDIDVMTIQETAASSVAFHLLTETNKLFVGNKKDLYKSSILQRASSEPHTGTCDAVVVLTMNTLVLPSSKCTIPNFINIPEDNKGLLPPLQRERHDADGGTLLLPAPSSKARPLDDKGGSTLRKPGDHRKKPTGDGIPQLSDEFPTIIPFELGGKIIFAILVVEHKRPGDDPTKPLNQARIYVEASVRLLEAHGIKGLPVFALATNGNEGVVLMAWRSETSERVYLIDRCVQKFNISSPIEVLHFVTFLLRLKDHYVEHFTKNPSQIEAANRAAEEMATRADKMFREAKEQGENVEVDIDWGWWKSAQTKRPAKDKSVKSKSELGKVVEGMGNMHLSG
ncbi:hypothetical protein EV421DRAFT_1734417 [Armillaria borealis]|uniref:Uncharacterized protein n=1 Tax=Armillaria borealis TaxID=47425 RepID=A0AA39JNA2_9AGAR|nr:hypothetical protein EV421DRAFT_1734417 [Armillaria borealis]